MPQEHVYELGSSPAEVDRLRLQAEALAAEADWLFDRLDIKAGQRVADIGCGPLGVLEMLANRVGREGAVLGVDVSPAFVEQARAVAAACDHTNIEIIQADASDTKLPDNSFDLVHARLLLVNLPAPVIGKVVAEMIRLARPGGYIALQDIDGSSWGCDPGHRAWDQLYSVFTGVVGDGKMGRRLPGVLRAADAVDVQCRAHAMFCPPGHLWRTMLLQFAEVTRPRALQLGLATAGEIDAAKAELGAHLDDPATTVLAPVLTQAWGRKRQNVRSNLSR